MENFNYCANSEKKNGINILKSYKLDLEKSLTHKYFKREGTPGHYKYYYTENEPKHDSREDALKYIKKTLDSSGILSIWYKDIKRSIDTSNIFEATHVSIPYDYDGNYIGMTAQIPKKAILSLEELLSKINKDKSYVNLSPLFSKLAKKFNIPASETTYGLSIDMFNRTNHKLLEIERLLNELKIQYTKQVSDADFVTKYVFSKNKENVKRIESLVEK